MKKLKGIIMKKNVEKRTVIGVWYTLYSIGMGSGLVGRFYKLLWDVEYKCIRVLYGVT